MAIKRIVSTEFWTDSKVVDLFSPEDKYFMLYLLTNPHTTQLGIYKLNEKIAAFETGYSVESVKVLLERFETKYELIKYSKDTKEIAIKNFLKHSIVKGGKPVEDLLLKEISQVKNTSLLEWVFKVLSNENSLNETVFKIINTKYNDNDNEESYHESYHESQKAEKPKRFSIPTLQEITEYCKERSNNVDPVKFYDYFTAGDWKDSEGKQVKNWKQKIITWERNSKSAIVATQKPVNEKIIDGVRYIGGLKVYE